MATIRLSKFKMYSPIVVSNSTIQKVCEANLSDKIRTKKRNHFKRFVLFVKRFTNNTNLVPCF